METLAVQLLDPRAQLPQKSHETDAGFDLYALNAVRFQPGIIRVRTGIAIALPVGYAAWIQGRSGATTRGVVVYQGLIDPEYRGELLVMVQMQPGCVGIGGGERFAQLVPFASPPMQVRPVTTLPPTERGVQGFGSTGRI